MSKLPIIMYHNVCQKEALSTGLTISMTKLEAQFQHLTNENYTSFHLAELENKLKIPSKSIVITFDDVTVNQLEYAVPLLNKYKLKATFFIPFKYIGQSDQWNQGEEPIMTMDMLKSLGSNIELGLHSFEHQKYATLTKDEIDHDFEQCHAIINDNNLKVLPFLAYPYGNYPKKDPQKSNFQAVLKQHNVKMGLRIGNKRNKFPFKNPYEITRIDIKGEDSLLKFKLKLRIGKLKLF